MPDYDGGTVWLSVVPSFRNVQRTVAAEAMKWGRDAGKAWQQGFDSQIGGSRTSTPSPGPSTTQAGRDGEQAGGAFATAFRRRVEAATRALPPVRIGVASSEAEQKLRDVRQQLEALSGRTLGVDLDAATAEAELTAIQTKLRELDVDGADITVRADAKSALAEIAAIKVAMAAAAGNGVQIPVNVQNARQAGTVAGGFFADGFRRRVEAATRSLPPVRIGMATSQAEQELRDLRTDLETLSNQTVGVDIDSATALAQVEALSTRLKALDNDKADVQVRADVAAALAQLAALQGVIRKVDRSRIRLLVDSGAFDASLRSSYGRLVALTGAIIALGPAAVPAGGVAAAAILGIGTAATASLAGIVALVIGFSGVGEVVGALGEQERAAGREAEASAQQQASAASQMESAQASLDNAREQGARGAQQAAQQVEDARRSETRAEEDAADAIVDARERVADAEQARVDAVEDSSRRVADARERVADAEKNAANMVVQALERQARAEQSLADAQVAARDAQESLTAARETEQQRIADLSNDVASAALDERQAVLDVESARQRLAETTADTSASELDRAQAQLSFEQAQQQLIEQQDRLSRLRADEAETARVGVEGAESVADARTKLRDAQMAATVTEAETAVVRADVRTEELAGLELVADAEQELAEVRQDAARSVADAQEQLLDAQAAVTEAEVDGAERVADARRGVTDALTAQSDQQRQAAYSVEQAMRSLEDAGTQAGTQTSASMDKLQEALNGVSPAGAAFAAFLFGLRPVWKDLQAAAQEGLLPGVQAGIEALLPYAPQITDFVGSLAGTLGFLAAEAGRALAGPEWRGFFDYMAANAGPILARFLPALGDLLLGLGNLMVAFSPLTDAFLTFLSGGAERFATWAAELLGSDSFGGFVDYVLENGPVLSTFFGSLVDAFVQLVQSAAPFGPIVLGILTSIFDFIAELPEGVLSTFFLGILGLITAFNLVLPAVGWVANAVGIFLAELALGSGVFGAFVAALGGPVGVIIAITVGVVALGAALIAAWQHSETFRDVVTGVWDAVGAGASWLWGNVLKPTFDGLVWLWQNVVAPAAVWLWEQVLKPAFDGFAWLMSNVVGPTVMWLWEHVLQPAWTGIQALTSVVWAGIQVALGLAEIFIRTVLAPVFDWLWHEVIQPAWDGIAAGISWVWENLLQPVFSALGGFIEEYVAPAFQTGVDVITSIWDSIVEAAKVPVRFVVDTVMNKGIIAGFNTLAKAVPGVDEVDPIVLPAGFAGGGVLPGYSPGVDDHLFYSPTAGRLALSGGEAIMRPEWTRAVGSARIAQMNALAKTGGAGAVSRYLGGFAGGGILDWLGAAKDKATDVISGVGSFITDPSGAMKKLVEQLLGLIPGDVTGNAFGQLLTGVPKAIADKVGGALSGLIGGGDSTGEGAVGSYTGPGGRGYQWQSDVVRAMFPGIRITSGYRPGSITASGNVSYHARGRAVDIAPPNMGIFDALASAFPNTAELIYSPAGARQIKNGQPHTYTGAVKAMHYNHVHWAYDQGGYLPPGITQVYNGTGKPEPVFTDAQWKTLAADRFRPQAPAESPVIINGNVGYDPNELVRRIDTRRRDAATVSGMRSIGRGSL